jgi:hypothetical protein
MKQSQGSVPVEDSLILMENSFPKSLVHRPISPDQSELVHLKNIQDRDILAKSVLFFCEKCHGPLVPIAQCHVCKKTSHRQCVQCYFQKISGKHDSCKNLVIFAKFRSKIIQNKK